MRRKAFGIGIAALLAAAALPLAALADNTEPPSTITTTQSAPSAPAGARAHAAWFAGSVTSAGSGSVSVAVLWAGKNATQLKGTTVSVAIDSSTQIVYGKGKSSIDPGDLVRVIATGSDASSLTARRIHVNCNCHWIGGTIGGISVHSLSVKVAKTGPYDTVLGGQVVTLQLDGSTQYIEGKDKKPITLSDLSVGDKVGVVFAASGFFKDPSFDWQNATFTATRVHLWRDRASAPSSSGDAGAAGLNP